MTRIKGVYVWFVLSVAVALALPPLLLRATPDAFESCQRRIGEMPPSERDRIDRNLSDFLAMDEAQRDYYRNMHQRLQEDIEHGQGTYAGLFENYTGWLQTIETGYRREQLRNTTDPGDRLELMRQIVDEQSEREMTMRAIFRPGLRPFGGRRPLNFVRRLLLPPDRYQAMMAEVERSIDMSRSQSNELEALTGIDRTFRLFKHLADGTPLNNALSQAEVRNVIAAAGIESLVETWTGSREAADGRGPRGPSDPRESAFERDPQRSILMIVIQANVRREFDLEVHQRRQPQEDDLNRFLDELSLDDRERLLRLQPEEFNRQLRELYLAEQGDLDWRVVTQGMFGRRPSGEAGPGSRQGLEGRSDSPRQRDQRQRRPGAPPRE